MSNYTIAIAWNAKDTLSDTDQAKIISGNDFDTEFTTVQVAVNSKANLNGSAGNSFSATTAPAGSITTQVATTEYVERALLALEVNPNSLAWPVGSIFTTTVSSNPSILLGVGTWQAYGQGRVLVGINTSDADFNQVNETGGAKKHRLTDPEMPAHRHAFIMDDNIGNANIGQEGVVKLTGYGTGGSDGSGELFRYATNAVGSSLEHNNLQPYIVVYMWRRLS